MIVERCAGRRASPCGRGGCSRPGGRARCRRSDRRRRPAGSSGRSGRTPSFSSRTIDRAASRRASCRSSASSAVRTSRGRRVDVGPLEQPEPELDAQDPRDGRVDQPPDRSGRRERLGQRRAVGDRPRQVHVDARRDAMAAASPMSLVSRCWAGDLLDPHVVRRRRCRRSPTRPRRMSVSRSCEPWQGTPSSSQ